MSPERDDPTDDHDLYEDIPPRSIFAAPWFRVVLVLIVLGVVGAVAVPYVLDWMNPPGAPRPMTAKAPPVSPPVSSAVPSSSDRSAPSDKSPSPTDKKDSMLIPVPAPAPPPAVARSEPKPEPTPVPTAKPAPPPPPKVAAPPPTDPPAKSAMALTESAPKSSPSAAPATKPPVVAKAETPKPETVAKADPAAKDDTKTAAAKSAPSTKRAAVKATSPTPAAATGPYWVQVGAFKDAETAKRIAAKLREQNFKVSESETQVAAKAPTAGASTPAAGGSASDQYDVYVSGMSAPELTKRLASKGLAAEASGTSVVVKPSLPLRDAVTLSKDLAVDGLKVQVRRAGSGPTAPPVSTTPPAAGAGDTLHRVRVGGFDDRAAAVATMRDLETKGYKPFLARGDQ